MRRRTSPVQQWVDALPSPPKSTNSNLRSIIRQHSVSIDAESVSIPECIVEKVLSEKENYISHCNMTVSTPIASPNSSSIAHSNLSKIGRDPSFQSDSSHCSSVESLLELRRADPEAVLLNLGFGGCSSSRRDTGPLSRIPKRFLQPSKLKGIAINDFVKHQQETNESLDSTSLGYRGLTGSPYIAPSEIVQKIMQRLREHEYHELDVYASYNNNTEPQMLAQQEGKLSVLSPDNRQFLERPRSKSPDMRNKRMIIGQKSFAFGRDGDLIEVSSSRSQSSLQNDSMFEYLNDTKEPLETTGPITDADKEIVKDNNSELNIERSKPRLIDLSSHIGENRDSSETVTSATVSNLNNNNNSNNVNDNSSSSNNNKNDNSPELEPSVDKNDGAHEIVLSYNSNLRRGSEGSCERSFKISTQDQEEGRRFSDGVMQSLTKDETSTKACVTSSMRRKSLKRQARIEDDDLLDNTSLNIDGLEKSTDVDLTHENRCVHCGKVETNNKDDEEEVGISCCYKSNSQKCWMEMEKVLQKNKKLEDVVAKSRREMAEIRDMLSNVLSVRMEPGF